jgi:ZIP family zinc transporter
MSRARAFYYGQLSAVVEPIAGVLGATLALAMTAILPYAMGFAAGAMIYVVVEELLPETERSGNTDVATLGFVGGFALMMVLDTGLS